MIGWLRKKVRAGADHAPDLALLDTPAPLPVREVRLAHEAVAARAAEIWRRKGRPFGQDEQNWLQAEAELRAELSGSADPLKPR
jgi:hypothetical protein